MVIQQLVGEVTIRYYSGTTGKIEVLGLVFITIMILGPYKLCKTSLEVSCDS